ncbi:MAG: membrane dipeptidase [Phycisphaeraceae bacterium]|nr:membrane dipeptidase [Phycisphaeraceae bacterium]
MRLMIDAHLDIAWNALSFDRDQRLPIAQLRQRETGMKGKQRGNCTVSLPELRRGTTGVCLATRLARALPADGWCDAESGHSRLAMRTRRDQYIREDIDFACMETASAVAQGQLAYYKLLERGGQMKMIRTRGDLDAVWSTWTSAKDKAGLPVGYILSMEGCDPIVDLDHVAWWWQQGLRTACLAHYGPSAYSMGTGGDGELFPAGRDLVRKFHELGVILDLVHTADTAILQAMDLYPGPVFVSHGNCRALVPGDRQISDDQIRLIAQRGGVIGTVLDNWMLAPGYKFGQTPRESVTLSHVADHLLHVCEVTGNARHAALGSDLDGGFGTEQSPADLDTHTDLHKLEDILRDKGMPAADIDAVLFGNWLRFFREALPA